MKILNLYAGIGGNRRLWGDSHEIVAVELDEKIAKVYGRLFPNDKVVIEDAHSFLQENFGKFDFIWSSPPCPSHSLIRKNTSVVRGQSKPIFPDMKLYEEILFLRGYAKNVKWVVENVVSWYKPLVEPIKIQRHFFWANFPISQPKETIEKDNISCGVLETWEKKHNFSRKELIGLNKRTVLRNCVDGKLSLHILNCSMTKDIS